MSKRGKFVTETADPIGALEIAGNELADLAEEMRSWADSMAAANMDHLEKYELVESAADQLENAELSSRVDTLLEALQAAVEGQEGHPACPKHQWGVACPVCKWSGEAAELRLVPPERHEVRRSSDPEHADKPMRIAVAEIFGYKQRWHGVQKTKLWTINAAWESGELPPPGVIENALARAQRTLEREEMRLRRVVSPPDGRNYEPHIEPLPGVQELDQETVSWVEFRPYGKKSPSRSDRFGNALNAARAGLDAVGHVLDGIKIEATDEDTPELELLETIRDALEECRESVSELESGVEFPGMY